MTICNTRNLAGELIWLLQKVQVPPYWVASVSPESFHELKAASTTRLVVSGRYSDRTIYGDPSMNWRQRAWHDAIHLDLSADTSIQGEARVSREQARQTEVRCGTVLANWVYADLWGQTLMMDQWQKFPIDQVAFTIHFHATGELIDV